MIKSSSDSALVVFERKKGPQNFVLIEKAWGL